MKAACVTLMKVGPTGRDAARFGVIPVENQREVNPALRDIHPAGDREHVVRKRIEAAPLDKSVDPERQNLGDLVLQGEHGAEGDERLGVAEEFPEEDARIEGDQVVRRAGHGDLVIEGKARRVRGVLHQRHKPFPGDGSPVGVAEHVADVLAGAVGNACLPETQVGNEPTHPLGADTFEEHVGGGVIALEDHCFQRGTRRDLARQVWRIEDGGAEREDTLVKCQLLLHSFSQLDGNRSRGRGIQSFLSLTEIFGHDEGFEGAGDDELTIRLEGGRPRGAARVRRRPELEGFGPRECLDELDDFDGESILCRFLPGHRRRRRRVLRQRSTEPTATEGRDHAESPSA